MMGPFLIFLGLLLFWIASQGKSDPFLKAIGIDFQKQQQDAGTALKNWMQNNLWQPMTVAIHNALPSFLRIGNP